MQSRYTWLLVGLLALTLLVPLAGGGGGSLVVLHVLSVALIAASLAAVGKRRHVIAALVLGAPSVVLSVVALAGVGLSRNATTLAHGSLTAFAAYTTLVVLGDVFRDDHVTGEKIRGAACVFFMIGATWTFSYLLLLDLDPGAISFPATPGGAASSVPHPGDVFYFSFTTLTSVGFGDILPVSAPARALAWLEALVAELYLAVLVARLVGLHIAHRLEGD